MIAERQDKGAFVFFTLSLFMVVLYEPITAYIHPSFKYVDEFVACFLVTASLLHMFLQKGVFVLPFEEKIIGFLIVIFLIGAWPYAHVKPPNGYMAFLTDFVIFYKIFGVYYSVRVLFRGWDMITWERIIVPWFSLMLLVLVVLVVFDKAYDLFPHSEERFGLSNEELFFGHSSRYAFFFQYTFIVLLPFLRKRNPWILITTLVFGGLSLRFKYFGFVPFALLFMFSKKIINTLKFDNIRTIIVLIIITVTILFTFWEHFKQNFLSEGYARAQLTRKSFEIAQDKFPVGSGFGTFGSHASGKYYSEIYYTYHLNNVYGLSKSKWNFMSDTFWPMVLGQFGYLGLLAYCFIIICFFRLLIELLKTSSDALTYFNISAILMLLSLIIDSTSDSILTHNRAVMALFYIGLVVNMNIKAPHPMGELTAVEDSINQ